MSEFWKEARKNAGKTQVEVSEVLDYGSPQFVSNWERLGHEPPPTALPHLVRLYKMDEKDVIKYYLDQEEKRIKEALSGRAKVKKRGRVSRSQKDRMRTVASNIRRRSTAV